jgi:hypothetical protein
LIECDYRITRYIILFDQKSTYDHIEKKHAYPMHSKLLQACPGTCTEHVLTLS